MFNIVNSKKKPEKTQPSKNSIGGEKNKDVKKNTRKQYPKKEYTQEQIKGFLNGYIEGASAKWEDIPTNSHMRYFKKDGSFVRGGFVTSHWLNKEGKKFIHLANNFNKKAQNYATWPVAHESVSRIFKKIDNKSGIEMDVVRNKTTEIISQINKLVDVVKSQQLKINNLESDVARLKSLVQNR